MSYSTLQPLNPLRFSAVSRRNFLTHLTAGALGIGVGAGSRQWQVSELDEKVSALQTESQRFSQVCHDLTTEYKAVQADNSRLEEFNHDIALLIPGITKECEGLASLCYGMAQFLEDRIKKLNPTAVPDKDFMEVLAKLKTESKQSLQRVKTAIIKVTEKHNPR